MSLLNSNFTGALQLGWCFIQCNVIVKYIVLQSVSSEEPVPVFELSRTSTVSSESGVYSLRSSEGDVPDCDSLEDSVNEVVFATDEAVFVEPLQVSSILKTSWSVSPVTPFKPLSTLLFTSRSARRETFFCH